MSTELSFNSYIMRQSNDEKYLIGKNNINSFEDLYLYNESRLGNFTYVINEENILDYITTNFTEYNWQFLEDVQIKDASGSNILATNGDSIYTHNELMKPLITDYMEDTPIYKRKHPGCGPSAAVGVLDYFGDALKFDVLLQTNVVESERLKIISDVMNEMNVISLPNDNYMTLSSEYTRAMNKIFKNNGLIHELSCNYYDSAVGASRDKFKKIINANIQEGFPITMAIGDVKQEPNKRFSGHYSNIFGY